MTTLFLDFDGVVNFESSRTAFQKNPDAFGYLRRNHVYSYMGEFGINYSDELVKKLNNLHSEFGFIWLWLSTWVDESVSLLDPKIGSKSDGFVDWNPHFGITNANLTAERARRKYAAVKENYDGKPFIWIDDEATVEFTASDFTVPTLVIAPDAKYGLVKSDLVAIHEFLAAQGELS
jgi:hypothetical protein